MNRERLERTLEILDRVPPERFDLEIWSRRGDCGTVACAIGHLAADPRSVAEGFTLRRDERRGIAVPTWYNATGPSAVGWNAVALYLDIPYEDAERLFSSERYDADDDRSPRVVAARVRAYLNGEPTP